MPKRGERKNSMVFWAFAKSAKNGEHWVTPQKFLELESSRKAREVRDRKKRNDRMRHLRATDPKYFYTPSASRKAKDAIRYQRDKQKIQARQKLRLAKNPQARLAQNMRTRLRLALHGKAKGMKSLKLFGCENWQQIIDHIESQFTNAMTWDNYGQVWHVDHIMPCASFDLTKETEKKMCFHYTNLQPLLAMENFTKNKKQPTSHQFKLL